MVYTVVAERTGVLKRLEEKKKEKEFTNKGVEKYFTYISWWSSPLGQNMKHAAFILERHSRPRPGRGHRKETEGQEEDEEDEAGRKPGSWGWVILFDLEIIN